MKKILVAVVLSMTMLTGCSLVSKNAAQENEEVIDNSEIIKKMEEMGITGEIYEGSPDDDTTPVGALTYNADDFVEITTDSGEIYYGAKVDGEIKVWEDGEYNKDKISNTDEYTKNTIIQITPAEGYSGDVTIYLHSYKTQKDEDYTVKEEDEYILNIDLDDGEYDITGYNLADGYEDDYALSLQHFKVSGDQTVVQTDIFKTSTE